MANSASYALAKAELKRMSKVVIPLKDLLFKEHPVFSGKVLFPEKTIKSIAGFIKQKNKTLDPLGRQTMDSIKQKIGTILSGKVPLNKKFIKSFIYFLNERLSELDIINENSSRLVRISLIKHQELFLFLKNNPEKKLSEVIPGFYGVLVHKIPKNKIKKEVAYSPREIKLLDFIISMRGSNTSQEEIIRILNVIKENYLL